MRKNTPDNFWIKVDIQGQDGCWEWQASIFKDSGYGQVRWLGKTRRSHILVYELVYGEVPEGMLICHACDNVLCCNPNHLYLGTSTDNKINFDIVENIRREVKTEKQKDVARRYNLSESVVSEIVNNKAWI